MNPRLSQLLGIILLIICAAMSYIVYQSTIQVGGDIGTLVTSGIIAWAILALPELVIGLWLIVKGTRDARVGDVSGRLIPLVQKEGRIGVADAARELNVDVSDVADAAEKLSRRRLPLVYLDRGKNEIVSPSAVSLEESLLHLLHAQRRMTFDQISRVTNSTDDQIVEALEQLSGKGKFRGTIDKNSRVVYTSEAVEQLPKAVTACPNCGGKLPAPVLPGEEEYCPYCGHNIINRLDI
ncbi:MAG: zinc ribbon domain-containing protein [Candidatus Thorarchaeota archaeon]